MGFWEDLCLLLWKSWSSQWNKVLKKEKKRRAGGLLTLNSTDHRFVQGNGLCGDQVYSMHDMCLYVVPLNLMLIDRGGFSKALPLLSGFVPPFGCTLLLMGFRLLLSRDAHVVVMVEIQTAGNVASLDQPRLQHGKDEHVKQEGWSSGRLMGGSCGLAPNIATRSLVLLCRAPKFICAWRAQLFPTFCSLTLSALPRNWV